MKKLLPLLLILSIVGCASEKQPAEDNKVAKPENAVVDSPSSAKLTTCPDCDGKVSKRTDQCPHCGAPLKPTGPVDEADKAKPSPADKVAAEKADAANDWKISDEDIRRNPRYKKIVDTRKAAADKAAAEKAAREKAATKTVAVEEVITLKGHTGSVRSVSFSPDGKRIVSGSLDNTLKVWNAQTGQETLTLKGHTGTVNSVSFSPDGRRIVSGSSDDTVKVWDADTGQEVLMLKGPTGKVYSVSFSPDGKRIVSGGLTRTVMVWDAQTGQETLTLKGHRSLIHSVAFSPDGKRIVSGSADRTVIVWDVDTGREMFTLQGYPGPIKSVSFSPDGKRIVTGGGQYKLPGEIKVWDAATGQLVFTIKEHSHFVTSVAFSPDGKRIVSGSEDETIRVWNAQTGQGMLTLNGHTRGVFSVAFSPDGKRIVSGGRLTQFISDDGQLYGPDDTVKVWNLADANRGTGRVADGKPAPAKSHNGLTRKEAAFKWYGSDTVTDVLPFTWRDVVAEVGKGPLVETGKDGALEFALYHARFKVVRQFDGIEVFFPATNEGLLSGSAFLTSKLFTPSEQEEIQGMLEQRSLEEEPRYRELKRFRVSVSKGKKPASWIRVVITPRTWATGAQIVSNTGALKNDELHRHSRYGTLNAQIQSLMTGPQDKVALTIRTMNNLADSTGMASIKIKELWDGALKNSQKEGLGPATALRSFSDSLAFFSALVDNDFKSWNKVK